MRKPINKLRFLKFLKKAETDQKYEETDLKFEETVQQIEIFKVFEKGINEWKIWGNVPKIWGNWSKYEETYQFKSLWKKRKRIKTMRKHTKNIGNSLRIIGKWEIPQKYLNKIKRKRIYNSGKSIKNKRKLLKIWI